MVNEEVKPTEEPRSARRSLTPIKTRTFLAENRHVNLKPGETLPDCCGPKPSREASVEEIEGYYRKCDFKARTLDEEVMKNITESGCFFAIASPGYGPAIGGYLMLTSPPVVVFHSYYEKDPLHREENRQSGKCDHEKICLEVRYSSPDMPKELSHFLEDWGFEEKKEGSRKNGR